MSLDLYQDEAVGSLSNLSPTKTVEPGVWDNFFVGAGKVAMRELAKAGRAVDLLGSVGPIIKDKINGNTELSDQYFKEHEEVFQKAVDYWAPSPHEVGVAGEVVGSLLGTLPLVFASPAFAVGATQLGQAEDLTRQGVDPTKAQAVGAVQAAGLGTGIWMPILGQSLAQRVLLGGAGFNVLQGVGTRAVSGEILEGTPQAEQFKAFDPTSMTIDVLLGMAFGGMAHLNPQQRAQGAEFLGKMKEWAENLSPSDKDALAVLRQGQHINQDTLPGKPVSDADLTAHVDRVRTAIEQLATDKPVSVEDMPAPKVEADPVRTEESAARVEEIRAMAESPVFRDIHTLPKEAQPKAIEDAVTRALTAIGRAPEEASAAGQLWSSFFKTAGERYGIAPAELLRKYGVDIRAIDQVPEGGMRLDQEGNVKTNTPEFKAWFGDSKVVDAEGKPLVVYHATKADFDVFNPNSHFGSKAQAEAIAANLKGKVGKNVIPVYLSAQKLKRVKDVEIRQRWDAEVAKAKKQGYDGLVYDNEFEGGGDSYVAFSPEQIKSATGNRGTFDPNDPNILHQGGDESIELVTQNNQKNRGLIKLDNGQTLIGLFNSADKSTFLHESGHFFLEVTRDLATKEGAPMAAMQDWATLSKWLGIEGGDIPRSAHEKFAEGFEQYLMEGKAPNEQLRGVFQQFRDWLVSIYKKVKADLSDDVRGVMDRMLTMSDTEKAVKAAAREASVAGMDPVTAEAYRLAQENPDVRIPVGTDANGEPIHQTVTEYLDAARADAEQARADSTLFEVAATCMLGRA